MLKTLKRIRYESKKSQEDATRALRESKLQRKETKEITGPIAETSNQLSELLKANHFAETLITTIRNAHP